MTLPTNNDTNAGSSSEAPADSEPSPIGARVAVAGHASPPDWRPPSPDPKLQLSIVDSGNGGNTNVFPIQFETQQAGYLAAGYSKTGKVGTYGGMKVPAVSRALQRPAMVSVR